MAKISRFTVALDTGAIIALSRGDGDAKAHVRKWASEDAQFIVPAPVLTESLRGGPKDAGVHHFLNASGAELAELSPHAARKAGEILGITDSGPERAIDAMIVAISLEHRASDILTIDPKDIGVLAPEGLKVVPVRG